MSAGAADRSPEFDPAATLEYWTKERMSRALPVEPPQVEPVQGEINTSAPPAQTDASEGPTPRETAALREALPQAFATALVSNPTQYPHRTVGKLFVRINNEDRTGSAAVVHRLGILTAAHCVRDPNNGAWATQVAFAPAFDNGPNPNFGGIWPVGPGFVRNEFLGPPVDVSFDFSFCRVPSMRSAEIGDVVGWLGIMVDRPDIRLWHNHGYPGAAIPHFPFDGLRMWNCTGDYSQTVGGTIFKDGNFTGGASGGPWIVPGNQGAFYANGTQSMAFGNPPTQNTSPYFRGVVMTLFHEAFG
jgi:V8-like Glu-specific endopeptidase